MALAPTLNQGISFEQPVAQPSPLAGVASVVGALAGATRQPSAADRERQFDIGLKQGLVDGLEKAQALREQGKQREALNVERKTLLQFSMNGGDLNEGDTKSLVKTYTGRETEDVGFSQEEVAFNQLLESPEFQSSFLGTFATHPDISEEERVNLAATRTQMSAANDDLIEQTRVDWNARQGQASRISKIEQWRTDNMGVLSISGANGGRVDQNAVQAAMVEFGNLKASILASRPAGLSGEEWKPVQDSIVAMEQQLVLMERLTSTEEVASDLAREFVDAIAGLPDVSAAEKNVAIQVMLKDPSAFLERGAISEGSLQNIFKSASDVVLEQNASSLEKGNGGGAIIGDDTPGPFTKQELEAAQGKDPTQKFQDASNLAKAAGGVQNVLNDQASLSEWIGFTRTGLASLQSMAAENDAWATAQGYRQYFNQNFFQTMDGLRNSGSTFTYDALRNKSIAAIDTNITALRAGIQVRTEGNIIVYDPASNKLVFSRDALAASDRLPPSVKAELIEAIDTRHGGDVMSFITREPSGLTSRLFGELQNSDVTDRIKAIDQLNVFKTRLPSTQGDEELQGGAGSDILGEGASSLVSLIDRTEGAGDYNTLFGFSNRPGGAFSNVNVSEMTLGELNDFSTGVYAEWSKGQLGKVATPMGKYQIVGTTMRQTAKEMGLPDNIVFTEEVQDAMFHHIAVKTLRGKETPAAKRKAMRATWEGFKNVPNSELDAAIAEFEGTPAPTLSDLQERESNTLTALRTSSRPVQRPEGLGQVDASGSTVPQVTGTPVQPQSAPVSEDRETRGTEGAETATRSPEASQRVWSQLEDQTKRLLIRLFGNEEAALQAIQEGEISEEDLK